LMIIEVAKGCIDLSRLTACQADAQIGLYARAMAGFVQWVAGHYDPARAEFQLKISEYRAKALRDSAHARTPDIIANLQAAFELFLEFAVAASAIDQGRSERLASRCWDALRQVAAEQAKHQKETEPTTRFLSLLSSVLTSGRAHLEARSGGAPDRAASACGWRCDAQGNCVPLGDRIGWVDEENVYLEENAAFRVVQTAGRDVGEILAVSESTLRKRLHEKHLLASIDVKRQTLTVRRTLGGSSKSVLHFTRATILPEVSDGDEDAD